MDSSIWCQPHVKNNMGSPTKEIDKDSKNYPNDLGYWIGSKDSSDRPKNVERFKDGGEIS